MTAKARTAWQLYRRRGAVPMRKTETGRSAPHTCEVMGGFGVGREPRGGYRITFAVPTKSEGASAARRVAREILVDWGLDLDEPVVDSAIVIISELVTNTAKHAALLCRQAEVTLALEYGCLSVAVHDR